jgi:hypothetical protein
MSPKELQGLQALAMAHGGSLTINPETGLPEAGFLDNILPAIAGFALNAFLPGAGEAVGGLFGLEGAAASSLGSALTVGGISGLASGSLEKGIMAGMGAYGGASLAGSMIGSGGGSLAETASGPVNATKIAAATDTSPIGTVDRLGALKTGANSAFSSPMDFLKDNKLALAAIAAPVLMDTFGNKDTGPEANLSQGYIRTMKRDPVTGKIYQESAIPTGEFGSRSVGTYGGVPTRGMADGGTVTDSQKAFDYLMGKTGSTNPMLFTQNVATGPEMPSDYSTRTGGHYVLDALTNTYVWVPNASASVNSAGLNALNNQTRGGDRPEVDPAEKDRVNALMDAEDAKDAEMGVPGTHTTQAARIKNDLGKFVDLVNPLGAVSAFSDGVKGFMDPRDTSNQGFGAVIGRGIGDFLNMGPGYESGPNSRMSAVGLANLGGDGGVSFGPDTSNYSSVGMVGLPSNYDASAAYQGVGEGYTGGNIPSNPMSSDPSQRGGAGDTAGRGEPGNRGDWGRGGGYANGGIASLAGGGLGSLGGYSDGGQLLKGPGDGVSDSIPAKIGRNQPARLADGEFVVPARIVSELGNGSTEAGAKQLYKMLDRIQAGRKKTVGKNKVAVNSKSVRHLPA